MADDKSLITSADEYAAQLLQEAKEGDAERRPPFEQRVGLLSSITRYLAVKNKLEPPPEEESPIAQFAKHLNGGLRKRGNGASPPAETS